MGLVTLNSFPLGDISDLTTPTSTQKNGYYLGQVVQILDSTTKTIKSYMYVKSLSAGMTAYQPYAITYGSTAGAEVITIVPFTLAAPGSLICVPQVAFTASYYGFVQIEGDAKVLMTAETYAVGDFLRAINSGTYLHVDGTSGATTQTVNSCAICKENGSTAVARKCWLFGTSQAIAAS